MAHAKFAATIIHDFEGLRGKPPRFRLFECAITGSRRFAQLRCKVIGHGVEAKENFFCSAHCARQKGVEGVDDYIWGKERETAEKYADQKN